MTDNQYFITPSTAASLSGLDVDAQRDLRARSILHKFGDREANGRWKFSAEDVIGMWIGRYLAFIGVGRHDAYLVGQQGASEILAIIHGESPASECTTISKVPYVNGNGEFLEAGGSIKSWPETPGDWPYSVFTGINWKNLAENVPDKLRAFIKEL